MSTAITKIGMAEAIEQVLIGGDLSKLNPEQRLSYYKGVCESLGLNPLTRPFDYINLNGKLVLYAKRDCTDQLRKKHAVSITQVDSKSVSEVFIVTAHAKDKDGREDSSTGAVAVANLKGDALANALMKAETKAKRRVTLSICGLGLLDETEVETIPTSSPTQRANGGANGSKTAPTVQPQASPAAKQNNLTPAHAPKSDWPIGHGFVQSVTFGTTRASANSKGGNAYAKVMQEGNALYCYDDHQLTLADGEIVSVFKLLENAEDSLCHFTVESKGERHKIVGATQIAEHSWLEDGTPCIQREAASPRADGQEEMAY